jgi:RHS repeat-associated protein
MPREQNSPQNNRLSEKSNDTNSNASPTTQGSNPLFNVEIPGLSLPKGGGAIKGIDGKFGVNAVNGSASFSIPLPSGSARGFGASLTLSYNSGSGNGIFGIGWSLSLPSVRRKTDKELPQYFDENNSDTYIFSSGEDLVPALKKTAGGWSPDEKDAPGNQFRIKRYRPRTEGAFARVERWTKKSDGTIHWRVISRDNVTSVFGDTPSTNIADPADAKKIFEWLLHFCYDDKGNCVAYEYKQEDGAGMDTTMVHNRNRATGDAPFSNTYLKRVWSGNIHPYNNGDPVPAAAQFLFETVLDYGEHDKANEPFTESNPWPFRTDAFSDYRPGFEIRTCRLCERVLLYHHFAELPGGSALVSALEFNYDNNGQIGNFTFLKEAVSFGYIKHADSSYTKKSLPPLSFTYQQHEWNKEIKSIAEESLLNAPAGLYEPSYQWVDLYSEGLNGILTEQANALYYKHNLGQGNFSAARLVSPKPSFTGVGSDLLLQELEANGTKYLAGYNGDTKGFFKLDDENEWHSFQAFEQMPAIDFADKNTRLIDLDGDGKSEILITEDNVFCWYPSKGEKGFDSQRKAWQPFDEEKGPRIVFNDAEQSIFLSDMSGDGLTDIVRIKNGSVCYWPNLGYGRFGAKVHMDNAPVFDHPGSFNPAYIKLADIDGSGTSDIIYLGKQKFSIWLNQNGNGFLQQPEEIDPFPEISGLSQVSVIDFLGTGTSCIVWSSPQLKDAGQPLRYIDLMNNKKPHLMIAYRNNMGKEVEFEYAASTWFYLQDKLNGTPWITKLPFPVHCLKKAISYDRIMKTRFASEYSYHHGYYDHAEGEFRGFGRVDQKDAEDITHFSKQSGNALNNTVQQDLHQPPVLTKTWFHTGAFLDREKILAQFANEYSQNSIHPENLLPEPELPADLSIDEWRQALRACKGMMLRKEVYALDDSPLSDKPYTVEQQNCAVRLVQPKLENKYASFLAINSESISYQYERVLNDPRIAHSFVLEADGFANVKKSVSLVYKRKNPVFPEQGIVYTTYTENDFTNPVDTEAAYRVPVLFQTKLFEVTGLPAPAGNYYTLQQIKTSVAAASFIDYDALPNGELQKRLVNWNRLQFRDDNGLAVLPFGVLPSKALLHQTFKAAFNKNQLAGIFAPKIPLASLEPLLLDTAKGGYVFADNYYWIPSVIAQYDIAHFFLTTSFTDPFGNTSNILYDNKYHLFIEKSTDALNNEILVKKFNYRVLNAYLMQDANDNLSAVRFDELGIVTRTFVIGKKGVDPGDEFDDTRIETSANDSPSSELEYHVFEWFDQSTSPGFDITNYKPRPNFIKTKVRDTHFHAHPLHQSKIQESYTYFSGSCQEALKKLQAEPGEALQVNPDGTVIKINTSPALRWMGTGRVILNNKGNPVKQYEPYFSVTPAFDDEKEMIELGVTPVTHYDAPGRIIRTDFPNKTFSKVEFTAWQQKAFDQNDTVAQSKWYDLRILNPDPIIATPEEISAAKKTLLHNNTPGIAHLDTQGRTFFTEADNVTEKLTSHVTLDIEGKQREITDALGRKVMRYEYDLLSRSIKNISMDAGTRWLLPGADNNPLLSWDDKNHEFSFAYDKLRRPVSSSVKTGDDAPVMFGRIEYAESLDPAVAKANNLRGITFKNYDQSGIITTNKNDFKGNLTSSSKQLVADYKNTIDWTSTGTVALEPEIFSSSTEYDALNRALKIIVPHSQAMPPCQILPGYNEAGILEKVDARIRNAAVITAFVTNINYDAKGQREEIFYANGTKTKYIYDKDTFRLVNLKTTRNAGSTVLQDIRYTYDPVGNITRIKDDAQPDSFFDGEQAQSLDNYEYDAVYRLIAATGRKHAGQTDIQPKSSIHNNSSSRNHPFIINAGINPNDAGTFRNYTESYLYDKAGNMKVQKHISKNSGWTRAFEYDNNNNLNNRLTKTSVGGDDYNYTYDAHGNMHGLETVLNEVWNFMDYFKEVDLGGGGTAFYVYDAGGQRARKVIERQNGIIQERIYLGGFEIYRERNNTGNIILQRETLHVMDDKRRIAMVDIPVIKPQGNNEIQLIKYQYDNHLGSASLELDDAAQIISYEEYFPYGATSYSATDATREVAAKRYRYTGKERDEESGLSYHGARYYAPWLCRWTKPDPIGIGDGLNVYIYVGANPINKVDPGGTEGYDLPTHEVKDGSFTGRMLLCKSSNTEDCIPADSPLITRSSRSIPPPPEEKKEAAKPKSKPKPKEEEKKGRELSSSELFDLAMALQPRYRYAKPVRQFFGGVKMIGGGVTAAGGYGFALFTAETGVGLVGGIVVGSYGADVAGSGWTTMLTGEESKTYTFMIGAGYTSMVTDDPKLINAGGQSLETFAEIGSAAFSLKISAMPINIGEGGPIAKSSLFTFRSPGKEPNPFLNLKDEEIDMALSSMKSDYSYRIPASATEGGTPLEGLVPVSRWGRPGLQPGDWVMPGPPTQLNYRLSFKWDSISPSNIVSPITAGQAYMVPAGSVKWPSGWGMDGWWKGLFGQRIYSPGAVKPRF